ncbi:ATP-binding protein [Nocardia sp. NBC_01388]|uniref:ATP-binding protein n=1 Tax=Nocardia sp. NBC_01388 TaxID=2903596 RepID=UPI003243D619
MTAADKEVAGHLPAEVTSFAGRRSELMDIKHALSSSRLVTLVGPGGVGKTRLALRAAAAMQRAYPDGVWFVDLAPLQDEELVSSTVAVALNLQETSARWAPSVLGAQLARRTMLLVLDNCEHLSYACAVLVDALLRECPEIRILATSRHTLEVSGERLLTVGPLPMPDPEMFQINAQSALKFDSVALFVDRAHAADPTFELIEDNARTVAELCRRLDGLPLAIELAAARVRHLSVQQILNRMDEPYGLLQSGNKVVAPRQRSLRSLISWSHDLCTADEQSLWARSSVFSGSFTGEAAEAVCSGRGLERASVLDTLAGLVDKSIVFMERHGIDVRYRMLDTIRRFGREQLVSAGEETYFSRAHRDYFRDSTWSRYQEWFGPNQFANMRWISRERDNLRAAIDFSLGNSGELPSGVILAAAVGGAAILAGRAGEGQHWIDRALAAVVEPFPEQAIVLWIGGTCSIQQRDLERADAMLMESRRIATLYNDNPVVALSLALLGSVRLLCGDVEGALAVLDQSSRALGDIDDPMCRAAIALQRGVASYQLGEIEAGIKECQDAIAISESHGEQWHRAEALWTLGVLYRKQGDLAEAVDTLNAALRINREFGNAIGAAFCFEALGCTAVELNEFDRAATLFGASDAIWRIADVRQSSEEVENRELRLIAARNRLGQRKFAEAYRRGERNPISANIAFALGVAAVPDDTETELSRLTQREREIACFIADGASNREIAARLTISHRTVEGHVEHILAKLGFVSRVQIAAWVTAQNVGLART